MFQYNKTLLIDTADLQVGMYVSQLEVPWSSTEFPLQGVLIRNQQDLYRVSNYGDSVYVDRSKFLENVQNKPLSPFSLKPKKPINNKLPNTSVNPFLLNSVRKYKKSKLLSKEINLARRLLSRLNKILAGLNYETDLLDDKKIRDVKAVSEGIVVSLLKNPDALLWLTKVNESNRRVFEHTIRSSIWATLIGRTIGLNKHKLETLNFAVLLSGIGKSFLRMNVWKNYTNQLIQPDFALWSSLTIEKLSHAKNIDQQVLLTLSNMTERYDGSGFPNQKNVNEIPLLAQIAGLADSFDLILQPMFSLKKITFGRALSILKSSSNTLFDSDLIDLLIQATGLYPVGTHVKLSNGYYGVVIEQSKKRRLRATIVLTHNVKVKRLKNFKIVRLGEGKFKKVTIRSEAVHMLDELVKQDFNEINLLIGQYRSNIFTKIVYFFRKFLQKLHLRENYS
jgi:HD-GYP domain-containing protein (c-di-GMP phosphodiesterase class II)